MPKKSLAVLGLGSNLGQKARNLARAVNEISRFCEVVRVSSVYKTASLLRDGQDGYFNLCVLILTDFPPENLLTAVKNLEKVLGRENSGRWYTRLIDIDIIDYDNIVAEFSGLSLPHKEMQNRSFVLYPLSEIYPNYRHPVSCLNVNDMVKNIKDDLGISKLGVCIWRS
ncbi:MAG: 2-amino-4-hydroxy-6-hydroxymethyldihydropteridine diphosphokinase [Deferribacterales bacterium]